MTGRTGRRGSTSGFTKLTEAKSRLAIQYERLPDANTAEEMRAWRQERLAALKLLLEVGGENEWSSADARVPVETLVARGPDQSDLRRL